MFFIGPYIFFFIIQSKLELSRAEEGRTTEKRGNY